MKIFRKWIFGLLLCGAGHMVTAQNIQVIKYPALQQILDKSSDSLLIVNFWATWCKPCVTELPYFNQIAARYADRKVKVVLVNLDGLSKLNTRVQPFLAKRKTSGISLFLLDADQDENWIERVSADWSGALPFTMMIDSKQRQRKTYEKSFTLTELNAEVNSIIKN